MSIDQDRFEKVLRKEDLIDKYETRLGAYLMRLTKKRADHCPVPADVALS